MTALKTLHNGYLFRACCDWYDGFVWKIENPRITLPIPIKGQLSIFEVPDDLIKYNRG